MTTLIEKYLPQHLWELAKGFTIPENFFESAHDVIQLVLESKSLAERSEKQNWFNLLPIMSEEQIDKLRDILTREKEKLREINEKYAKKKAEMNKRYQQNLDPKNYQQAQQRIREQESKTREQELVEADNLLSQM